MITCLEKCRHQQEGICMLNYSPGFGNFAQNGGCPYRTAAERPAAELAKMNELRDSGISLS
ncbi:MAG: hypothetical protein LBQ91_05425 [Oscillospiraceae bacterium]|nr:hypothetical protein [Oscillospiraceae bacterium]